MFGLYLGVIAALLLIYPDSTSQCKFGMNTGRIKEKLRKEKSLFGSKIQNVVCDNLYVDERKKLCDEAMILVVAYEQFTVGRPQKLYTENCRNIRVEKFLDRESTLPVPQLAAGMGDSYTCKRIPIEDVNMEKRMFWCKARVFTYSSGWQEYGTTSSESDSTSDSSSDSTSGSDEAKTKTNYTNATPMLTNPMKTNSNEKIAEAEGFFITGSRLRNDEAYILKPSPNDSRKVFVYAQLWKAHMLTKACSRSRGGF